MRSETANSKFQGIRQKSYGSEILVVVEATALAAMHIVIPALDPFVYNHKKFWESIAYRVNNRRGPVSDLLAQTGFANSGHPKFG